MVQRIIAAVTVLVVACVSVGVYFLVRDMPNPTAVTEDSLRFKMENEALNSVLDEEGNHKYTSLAIREDNHIVYLTYEELLDFYNNKTGILYFGRPACPWCRLLIPFLLDFAKEENINIYYFDIEKDRDENTSEYQNILSRFEEYLPTDTVTQNENDQDFNPGLKRVVLPHLFFIQKGNIKAHLPMFQHAYLSDNEPEKVKQLLRDFNQSITSYFDVVFDDEDCEC